jgi:two-component system response regulator AtoC
MSARRLLIVDDEEVLTKYLKMGLEDEGYEVAVVRSGEEALEAFSALNPDLVLLDIRLPGMDGIEALSRLRGQDEDLPVILITAHGDTRSAVQAMKLGATDYLTKPFEMDELSLLIRQALEARALRREVEVLRRWERCSRFEELVGESRAMQEVYRAVDELAQTDSTVLIQGESGTGKELIAGAIHRRSHRRDAPFVEVACPALPETLLESELFGHEKGAFTDAKATKRGLFELAEGGTLFLDEIGDMPLSIQAKLLRALEKKRFKRVGGTRDIQVDVRILAATNRDLDAMAREGRFRSDLFYRLNVFPVRLPPLRERGDDVVLLADHFLEEFCRELGKPAHRLAQDVIERFRCYPWRGNVRELRNLMERLALLAKGGIITRDLLPREFHHDQPEEAASADSGAARRPGENLDAFLERVERTSVEEALRRARGNRTQAAALLGISRFSLMRRERRFRERR